MRPHLLRGRLRGCVPSAAPLDITVVMRPEDLKLLRDRTPFVPFRLLFTDGRTFEVPHRDFLMISKHVLDIGTVPDPVTGLPGQIIYASPLHVVRVEQMESALDSTRTEHPG